MTERSRPEMAFTMNVCLKCNDGYVEPCGWCGRCDRCGHANGCDRPRED